MNKLIPLFATRPMWGIVPVRIAFGLVLMMSGTEIFSSVSPTVGILTVLLGTAMILGLFCRIVGTIITIIAISNAFLISSLEAFVNGGVLNIFGLAFALMFVFSGAGRFSVDRAIARRLLKKYPSKKW